MRRNRAGLPARVAVALIGHSAVIIGFFPANGGDFRIFCNGTFVVRIATQLRRSFTIFSIIVCSTPRARAIICYRAELFCYAVGFLQIIPRVSILAPLAPDSAPDRRRSVRQ